MDVNETNVKEVNNMSINNQDRGGIMSEFCLAFKRVLKYDVGVINEAYRLAWINLNVWTELALAVGFSEDELREAVKTIAAKNAAV